MMSDTLPVPRSVWLVARRVYGSLVRARLVLVCTAIVAVLLLVFLVLQGFVFTPSRSLRVGLAGQAISLQQGLPQQMSALGVAVSAVPVDTVDHGVAQVRGGQLDVLVYGSRSALRVTVEKELDPRLRATLDGQVRQQILDAQLAQLGAKPDDVLGKIDQAQISVTQLDATDPNTGQRAEVGIVTSLLVTGALMLFAGLAARRLAEDIVLGAGEALLTVLRPRRLLAGNLGGVGLAGLVHVTAVGVLGVVLAVLFGVTAVPSALLVGLFGGLLWFVLGYALYGTLAAALTGRFTRWHTVPFVLAATLAIVVVPTVVLLAGDPGGTTTAVLSVLPPFAPVLMPGRMAAGTASGWQVLLAVVVTLTATGALAWPAARTYPRSLLGREKRPTGRVGRFS
jgi:ABC-2 type transport system permease protein